jgi:hypothetical protein
VHFLQLKSIENHIGFKNHEVHRETLFEFLQKNWVENIHNNYILLYQLKIENYLVIVINEYNVFYNIIEIYIRRFSKDDQVRWRWGMVKNCMSAHSVEKKLFLKKK